MILTAQNPAGGSPSIPLSFLEEVGRVMSQHKAVRVRVDPEDEAVTVEEAARFLEMSEKDVHHALKFRLLKQAEHNGVDLLIRLDSLLEFQRNISKPGPLDETTELLIAAGLY